MEAIRHPIGGGVTGRSDEHIDAGERRGVCGAIAFCIDTSITAAFCNIVFAGWVLSGFMRYFFFLFFFFSLR